MVPLHSQENLPPRIKKEHPCGMNVENMVSMPQKSGTCIILREISCPAYKISSKENSHRITVATLGEYIQVEAY